MSGPDLRRFYRGFTLVELAVVLAIVGFLLGSLMLTLSAQMESRNTGDTQQRLEQAKELLLAFAIVNGRVPCPARSNSAGAEVRDAVSGVCTDGAVEDYYGGTPGGNVGGLLPATTIGFQPVDSQGFALDAWGNRIRYAVARVLDGSVATCPDTATFAHFTLATKLKSNGITCAPKDLIVCNVTQAIAVDVACAANTAVTNRRTVAAIVLSTGKNGVRGPQGTNETENVDGNHVFVSKTPDPSGVATGEFDDLLVWIPVGVLYGKLISAGVLP